MADKIREKNQYNLLKSKYASIGNPDTTDTTEFLTNIHKDTISSLAHHSQLLLYNSIVLNQHPYLLKQELIKKINGKKSNQ
ncbi:hypothetical protein JA1_002465 [Spathaspora sp. JA1]|nr:hypothetical protein JA1_002465 [Spathaspora sp. JA1]